VEAAEKVQRLQKLKGIGETSSWLFVVEFFGWRQFRNRREVAGLAGLSPMLIRAVTRSTSNKGSARRGIVGSG
jgi:transposase